MYDFAKLKEELKNIGDWFSKELLNLRTGTATPSILDDVKVESYGAVTPVNQMANITVEDAKNLKINPYDSSQIQDIEKSIVQADLGVAVSVDGSGVRLSFPDLTGERREELIKKAKSQLEQAKINTRSERDKVWNDIQSKEKDGEISQDEKFTFKDQMQEVVDDGIKQLEGLLEKKESEIRG